MSYYTVLVPVAGESGPDRAVDHALALADRLDASVVALSVVDLGYSREEFPDETVWSTTYDRAERDAQSALDAVVERARDRHPSVTVERRVRHGHPVQVVLDTADETGSDLLVMESHETSRVRRLFAGSTVERVVRSSPVPVVTMRPDSGESTTDYERLLVATDGSPGSTRAVEYAVDLAAALDATLSALSVVEKRFARSPAFREFMEAECRRALDGVGRRAAAAGVAVDTTVTRGDPGEAVVRHCDTDGADLVVIGTHGKTGLDRVVMGSVSTHVVRNAPVPALTVRATTPDESS